MYSSEIEYIPTNRFSMSLLDYFGSNFITMKLQIPHIKNPETLRDLLNKYSIVHWSMIEDSETRTVFRNNLNQNNMNQIIIEKTMKPSNLNTQPDDVLIKKLEARGYVVKKFIFHLTKYQFDVKITADKIISNRY